MDERRPNGDGPRRSGRPTRRAFLAGGIGAIGTAWLPAVGAREHHSDRNRANGHGQNCHRRGGDRDDRGDRGRRDGRADRDHRNPYERSLALRERAGWSNATWREYLTKRGIDHGVRRRTYPVPKGSSVGSENGNGSESEDDGGWVSTQKFDRYELEVQVTYSRPRYVGYDVIDVEWAFTDQELDDFAQSPADNVAISFRPAHYAPTNAREEWVYYGRHCSDPDGVDSKTAGGSVCEWRDIGDRDDRSHFGVYVEPNWHAYSAWERRVYVDFVHTWSGYGLSSVGVGLGGISMGFETDTDRWDVEDSAAEARLIGGKRITG